MSNKKIYLKEGGRIISDGTKVAKILNIHFIGAICSLAEEGGCIELVLDYNSLENPVKFVSSEHKSAMFYLTVFRRNIFCTVTT